MSIQDFNTVRRLSIREIIGNPRHISMVREYAEYYCDDTTAAGLKRLLVRLTQEK